MSTLKRAITWEISDSENESDSVESKTITPVPASRTDCEAVSAACLAHVEEHSGDVTRESSPASPCPGRDDAKTALVPPAPVAPKTHSPGRRRRTKEEIEADRLRVEERRMAREKQRQERAQEKEEKRLEQRKRKEAADVLKRLKPENCLKSLTVRVHSALLQDVGSDLLFATLLGLEWRCSVEAQSLTHSVTWTREPGSSEDDEGVQEEEQVLMVLSLTEFMDMVVSVKQTLKSDLDENEKEEAHSLFQPLCEFLNRTSDRIVTVLVMGSQQNIQSSSWVDGYIEQSLRSELGLPDVDIEEVLVYLQLYKNVSVHFLSGWQEVTDHVCAVTKALSKRPLKALTERAELGFCVDGSWAGGVRVDRDGTRLAQVWTRQIQQLNRVSVAMANAVTIAYPSPQVLLQAYEKAESEGQKRGLLADLPVRGGAKERRVGPELSNRVHRLFTSPNPHLVLD